MENKPNIEEIATFCKKKGFIFQAAEIYGGLSGFFDFGPLGVELKNNLKQLYWKKFVKRREDIVGQDGSIITNPRVWKASGHIDNFADLVLTTKETKTKLRADHFIEDSLNMPADGMNAEQINNLIKEHKLSYKGEEFEQVKDFNLMFQTQVGPDTSKNSVAYLRPETCQSIFPNFRLIAESSRMSLPFGIAQIGKAFRNEISPRDFVFRCREFEQMEMEYFFNPESECAFLTEKQLNTKFRFLSSEMQDKDSSEMIEITLKELIERKKIMSYHGYWLAEFFNWFVEEMGFAHENLRIREHVKTELSHYSTGTFDIDYNYPFGFKEMLGMANRGDYDLKQHQEHSKAKLEFFDEFTKTKLIPHAIEPSLGVERFMMTTLFEAYNNDKERGNIVLKLPSKVAPYKVAILPLVNKEPLIKLARNIFDNILKEDIEVFYDKSGSIGRRYARQDEIGTPYSITVDFESIEEGKLKDTVTIRDRDTTQQARVLIEKVPKIITSLIKGKLRFEGLQN